MRSRIAPTLIFSLINIHRFFPNLKPNYFSERNNHFSRIVIFVGVLVFGIQLNGFEVKTTQLDNLISIQKFEGDSIAILHVYSDYPKYDWVPAKGEGIACVDDATRGVVAYLKHYELTHSKQSLQYAKYLLNFIFHMQAEDGGFYNFIREDLSINKTGETSNNNKFNWWSARAVWAMGYAYYKFKAWQIFLEIRDTIHIRMTRAFGKMNRYLQSADRWQMEYGEKIPASDWLLNDASNMSSEMTLGLIYYAVSSKDSVAVRLARQICDGLAAYQFGDSVNYPFGLHPDGIPNIFRWHAWGSRETQALATAARLMHNPNPEWRKAAKKEADNLWTHMLMTDRWTRYETLPWNDTQINYDMAPVVNGFAELYYTTGDAEYAKKAALYATWWFGNNPLHDLMYDESAGRFYDGIDGNIYNRNSGGETNTEGLMALLDVKMLGEQYADLAESHVLKCQKIIYVEAESSQKLQDDIHIVKQEYVGPARISSKKYLEIGYKGLVEIPFSVKNSYGDSHSYLVYLHMMKYPNAEDDRLLQVSVDGAKIGTIHCNQLSPDQDSRFTMAHLAKFVSLKNGNHTIQIQNNSKSNLVIAVDVLFLQPVVERKTWKTPDGSSIEMERNILPELQY